MSHRQECVKFRGAFVALVPLALLVMTGCPSLSTMQTPATVPKGEVRLGMGLESVGFSEKDSNGTVKTDTVPQFEFNARYGLTDNIDVGAKLYLLGLEVGGKYQFAKGDFEAAIAPAVSYISVTDSENTNNGNSSTFRVAYLHLPLLLGYKLTDSLELAFGPKVLYVIASGTVSDSSSQTSATSSGLMAGGFASIQLRLGKAFWLAPEINVYKPFAEGASGVIWQGGLALLFGGAPPPPMGPPQ